MLKQSIITNYGNCIDYIIIVASFIISSDVFILNYGAIINNFPKSTMESAKVTIIVENLANFTNYESKLKSTSQSIEMLEFHGEN